MLKHEGQILSQFRGADQVKGVPSVCSLINCFDLILMGTVMVI